MSEQLTKEQAYRKGWDASKRTATGDLEAAEDRFGVRWGSRFKAHFAAGWIDFAAEHPYGETLDREDEAIAAQAAVEPEAACEECGGAHQSSCPTWLDGPVAVPDWALKPSHILCTALESGFGWFRGVRNDGATKRYLDVLDDFDAGEPVWVRAEDVDEDGFDWVRVTPRHLVGCITTLARFRTEKWGWAESGIPRDRSEWDFDACDADAVLQLAIYGEVVFG